MILPGDVYDPLGIECECSCHTNPEEIHVEPCCAACKDCGKRIPTEFMDIHRQGCEGIVNAPPSFS